MLKIRDYVIRAVLLGIVWHSVSAMDSTDSKTPESGGAVPFHAASDSSLPPRGHAWTHVAGCDRCMVELIVNTDGHTNDQSQLFFTPARASTIITEPLCVIAVHTQKALRWVRVTLNHQACLKLAISQLYGAVCDDGGVNNYQPASHDMRERMGLLLTERNEFMIVGYLDGTMHALELLGDMSTYAILEWKASARTFPSLFPVDSMNMAVMMLNPESIRDKRYAYWPINIRVGNFQHKILFVSADERSCGFPSSPSGYTRYLLLSTTTSMGECYEAKVFVEISRNESERPAAAESSASSGASANGAAAPAPVSTRGRSRAAASGDKPFAGLKRGFLQ